MPTQDDDEKCLKAQGHQGAQVILAHAAPFPSHHGRHRDGRATEVTR